MLLDKRVFKSKSFYFGLAEDILKILRGIYHSACFSVFSAMLKILRNSVFELAGLTDIDYLPVFVSHYIDTRG